MSYRDSWMSFTSDRAGGFGRLRTDVSRTSFFEGREFRTYKELDIAASATYVMKIVVPTNIILYGLAVAIDSGWVRIGGYAGGTEGGTYSETLPMFAINGMSAGGDNRRTDYNGNNTTYTRQLVMTAGGTHTGGIELDVSRVKVSGNSNASSTVGEAGLDERGVAAGTYYFRFLNLSAMDAITGVFRMRWEERP
jgi:hypothetical protein